MKKYILSFVWGAIIASWALYAAGTQITSLTQSVSEWDIITSSYYNNLNGSKSEWKACKFAAGKLVCIDEMTSSSSTSSSSSSWGPVTSQMYKSVFTPPNRPSKNATEDKQNVKAWNDLVAKVEAVWIEHNRDWLIKEWRWVPGGWIETCTMKEDTIRIAVDTPFNFLLFYFWFL